MQTDMLRALGLNWGWIVFRGVVAVLFGVLAIAMPGITLASLVIVWGAYAIADGLLAVFTAFQVRDHGKPFWSLIVIGLLGIAAGVGTFFWPAITALALLMVIAAWAVGTGIFQIVAAVRLRKEIEGEWLLGLSGVLSVIFGALMIVNPGAGALAMLAIVAAYAIMFGILLIVLGFRLKTLTTTHRPATV